MSKNSTITSGLGLKEEYFEHLIETVGNKWKQCETVSDLMISSASEIKYEEFEVNDNHLSDYEKKLVLLGMVIGLEQITQEIKSNQAELMGNLFKDLFGNDGEKDSI
jgi:organic radical activating enzyme